MHPYNVELFAECTADLSEIRGSAAWTGAKAGLAFMSLHYLSPRDPFWCLTFSPRCVLCVSSVSRIAQALWYRHQWPSS